MEGLRPKDPKDGVRKRRLWFSKEDDVEMLRIVVAENPFEHIGRWTYIANVLKSRRGKVFAPKSVRQRVTLLLNNFNVRMMAQRASGKKEGCDKLKQLVQEVSGLKDEAKRCPSEKKRERKRAAMGMALRDKAAMALMDVPVDSKVMPSDELPEELLVNVSQSTMEEESDLNRSSPSTLPNAAYSAHPPAQSTATILPVGTPLLVSPGPERAEKRLRQEMMDQAIWKKLKEEHDLKVEQVAIERLKAENERAKLEIERTMENNSFELRCRQMDLLQENMDQMRRFMSDISELNKHFLTNTIQIMEKIVDKLVQKQN